MTTPALNPPQQPKRSSWFAHHKILTSIGTVFLVGASFGAHRVGGHSRTSPATTTSSVDSSTTPDAVTTPAHNPPQQPKRPSWFARHKMLTSVVALFLVGASFGAHGAGGHSRTSPATTTSSVDSSSTDATNTGTAAPTSTPGAKPALTAGQENALRSAKDYLNMTSFSRAALIRQLSSSAGTGYSLADATFAVDHLKVDWNEEAVKAAKDYLNMASFSRAGLIQQLSSQAGDGYTQAQAVYAANHVGL